MKCWLTRLFLSLLAIPCGAKSLQVAVGLALPPYVISEQNRGFELDIVREALATQGHTITPVYAPFRRVPELLREQQVDAAITVTAQTVDNSAFLSTPYITYRNVAVALSKRQLVLHSVSQLASYSVLAFQNAHRYLGAEFRNSVKQSPDYQEIARQSAQITMLYGERVDVIVLDHNIFHYYRQQEQRVRTNQAVDIFPLFEPIHYQMAFRQRSWRDDFDRGLQQLRATGRYQQIVDQYLQPEQVSFSNTETAENLAQ
ncbi:hypothetical protein CHH28_04375 [Bacterioplanes sanyensis]|uniref:Solute-binding protein family 3/N-terminal domain-containing protein n=1 Tax=Bacterioplanes sanyensis TaxID=1249553 RepID=A0A222FGT7_9GAMM|nr:transporter substrate-binding domain-containing protein [Bacterioplanes sanyensis]ASP37960.1 hypothetical protein CHH28_04375 [Bacterioplanes sanyensis]